MLTTEKLTASVQRELVKLLRRIENNIDPQENIDWLWSLCEQEMITFECLQELMQQ